MTGPRELMELLFRKHFWAIHLLFLFLAAWLVAGTGNHFVEAAIAGVPSGSTARPSAPRSMVPAAPPSLSMERLAALTGLPVPKKEPDVLEPSTAAMDENAEPVRTGLKLKLLGTLLAGLEQWSFCSIQDTSTQKTQTYMIGDLVLGAEIKEIQRTRVIINNNGRKEFIDSTPGDGSAPVAYVPPPSATPGGNTATPTPGVLGAGIRAITENEYEVPKTEIDKTLANLNDVAMQARIVPAFKDGVAQGFKLFSIRQESIYSKIGVQNGDVIKRINGYDLNSPEKALEIYTKLKEASRIDIEIERNGSTVRKTYNVR